jgi:phytoene/squalene synthetase
VDELLRQGPLPLASALSVCQAWLRSRWWPWRVAWRAVPRGERSALAAVCAWCALLGALDELPDDELAPRVRQVADELDALFAGRPRTALGSALLPIVRSRSLPAMLFRGPLQAVEQGRHVHAFETQEELVAHARKRVTPQARLVSRVAGPATAAPADRAAARRDLLSEALAIGLQLGHWITRLGPDVARGRLFLPAGELRRAGVDLARLHTAGAPVVGASIAAARAWLAKGWPLCLELGPVRGRALAVFLRWHAAGLSAVEARGNAADPPPAGWIRLVACTVAGVATRSAPSGFDSL